MAIVFDRVGVRDREDYRGRVAVATMTEGQRLSPRERQVLALVADGWDYREIAEW
jgi:DNA-binding NarL/FixJ family response regulator